jgi:hypothetical protein
MVFLPPNPARFYRPKLEAFDIRYELEVAIFKVQPPQFLLLLYFLRRTHLFFNKLHILSRLEKYKFHFYVPAIIIISNIVRKICVQIFLFVQ